MTILLAEHRLERCLAAADRVIAMDVGSICLRRSAPRLPRLGTGGRCSPGDPRRASLLPRRNRALARRSPRRAPNSHACRARRGDEPDPLLDSTFSVERSRRVPCGSTEKAQAVRRGSGSSSTTAVDVRDLWVELVPGDTPRDVLRGIDLNVAAGRTGRADGPQRGRQEHVAARPLAGLIDPVRGKVEVPAGIALLTQNPSDYLVRERVGDELPGEVGRGGPANRRAWSTRSRPIRATSPAASASGWRWRSPWRDGWTARSCRGSSRSTSRRGAWTAPARTTSSS